MAAKKTTTVKKGQKKGTPVKKKRLNLTTGIFHIRSSYNNTIVSFGDEQGNVLKWASSGSIGYKGTKKKTSYAAALAATKVLNDAKTFGIKEIYLKIRGVGGGKDAARKVFETSKLLVKEVRDVTPVPHNGTRPPKKILKRLEKKNA